MNYYNYFTEIEEHFVRRRGKHLLISPMDWGLIAAWREAGVPLQVALRGIDIAMDGFFARPRGSLKVNTLCYCHDSVLTEYANYLESRIGESAESGQALREAPAEARGEPSVAATLEFISERIHEIKSLAAKLSQESAQEGIGRVLARLEEVWLNLKSSNRSDSETLERDLAIIGALLVAELRAALTTEEIAEWEKEAKKGAQGLQEKPAQGNIRENIGKLYPRQDSSEIQHWRAEPLSFMKKRDRPFSGVGRLPAPCSVAACSRTPRRLQRGSTNFAALSGSPLCGFDTMKNRVKTREPSK